jgi:hypothetical protein
VIWKLSQLVPCKASGRAKQLRIRCLALHVNGDHLTALIFLNRGLAEVRKRDQNMTPKMETPKGSSSSVAPWFEVHKPLHTFPSFYLMEPMVKRWLQANPWRTQDGMSNRFLNRSWPYGPRVYTQGFKALYDKLEALLKVGSLVAGARPESIDFKCWVWFLVVIVVHLTLRISEEKWDKLVDIMCLGEWALEQMLREETESGDLVFPAEMLARARRMLTSGYASKRTCPKHT